MRFYSFSIDGYEASKIEVEVSLIPGAPIVQFMGLPDMAIKESVHRVRSAFRAQGFEWPRRHQVYINLRPAYLKKSSQGLDLALAVALLWKMGKLDLSCYNSQEVICYGELSLSGEVEAPEDLYKVSPSSIPLITGRPKSNNLLFSIFAVEDLKTLTQPEVLEGQDISELWEAPDLLDYKVCTRRAELLKLLATGEHSVLMAGPAGSGKSTIAEMLYGLLAEPSREEFIKAYSLFQAEGRSLAWRPYIAPHHSTPPLAMIGGGYPPFPGEISRAHSGILLMDEYLEFHPRIQEALREPMEKGEIRIVRKGDVRTFPASFQLVATTNLCPCGSLVPGRGQGCNYTLQKCRSHLDRLSGPMLDRFDVLAFSHEWHGVQNISLGEIKEDVKKGIAFQKEVLAQGVSNSRLDLKDLESRVEALTLKHLLPEGVSQRRRRALLRIAKSYADLEGQKRVEAQHLDRAWTWGYTHFEAIRRI